MICLLESLALKCFVEDYRYKKKRRGSNGVTMLLLGFSFAVQFDVDQFRGRPDKLFVRQKNSLKI